MGVMNKFRFWVSVVLIVLVMGESAYLLWRENYFTPNLTKRTQTLETQLSSLKAEIESKENIETVSVEKLMTQSQAPNSPSSEEGKVAGTQSVAISVEKKTIPAKEEKINLNTASAIELDKLPGIGPAYANRIIQYREQNGPFKNPEDIKKIKGIGDATFNKLKDQITI